MGACASASVHEPQAALKSGTCGPRTVEPAPPASPASTLRLACVANAASQSHLKAQAKQQLAALEAAHSAARQDQLIAHAAKADGESIAQHVYALLSDLQPTDCCLADSDNFLGAASTGQPHDVMLHGAPRTPNNDSRRATMRTLGLEGAGPCAELDVLSKVVARMFGTKCSCVALFGESLFWLAAGVNLPVGPLPWRIAACPWDLLCPSPTTMVCQNLAEDARFEHMPYTRGGMRTYVAAPLIASNGHRIGTICFLDDVVHTIDAGHCRLLNNLAEIAVREVERFAQLDRKLLMRGDSAQEVFLQSRQKHQRNMESAHGSCLILVDVSVPGWEILYATPSWDDWTGVSRDACVGGTLADALECALSPGAPLGWEDCMDEVGANGRFMMAKLQARGGGHGSASGSTPSLRPASSRGSGGGGGGGDVFDLSFRPASLEGLDADTLPIGIPSFVPMTSSFQHIYVARLHAINISVPLAALGTGAQVNPHKVSPLVYAPQLIYGLQLHQVIGRGGYGTVYHAAWHDTEVAAKVQDHLLTCEADQHQAELEISLGQMLTHSNVVHTLAHASVRLERHAAPLHPPAAPPPPLRPAPVPSPGSVPPPQLGRAFFDGESGEMSFEEWASDCMLNDALGGMLARGRRSSATYLESPSSGLRTSTKPSVRAAVAGGTPSGTGGGTGGGGTGGGTLSGAAGVEAPAEALDRVPADRAWPPLPALLVARGSSRAGLAEEEAVLLLGRPHQVVEAAALQYPCEVRTFQVLEFCDKGCLQDAIDRGWLRTSPSQLCGPDLLAVLATSLDIVAALTFLHARGVVHGDLTAHNVLLKSHRRAERVDTFREGVPLAVAQDAYGRDFTAKVADFGKSRPLGAEEYIRTSSYGTISHMAPEVLLTHTLGRPADIFAFGVLLWAMWTGSRPWGGLSHQQVFDTVTSNTHTLTFPDATPTELSRLGARCLSHAAADRPTIAEVAAVLELMLLSRGAPLPTTLLSRQASCALARSAQGSAGPLPQPAKCGSHAAPAAATPLLRAKTTG